jgi:mRNA interferase MazF
VQSDVLHLLSTWLVAPTSTAARPATFRPSVEIDGTETRVLAVKGHEFLTRGGHET